MYINKIYDITIILEYNYKINAVYYVRDSKSLTYISLPIFVFLFEKLFCYVAQTSIKPMIM